MAIQKAAKAMKRILLGDEMLGHKQVVERRKEGYRPEAIFVQAGFEPVITCCFDEPERALDFNLYPEIWIAESELGCLLDLRFVVGCRVHVHGKNWSDELLTFLDRLVEAKPLQVIVCTDENGDMMIFENEKWRAYASTRA